MKKMIDKLNVADIKPSSRHYPAIIFERDREAGDQILNIEKLSTELDGELLFQNIDLNLNKGIKSLVFQKIQELQPLFMKSSAWKTKCQNWKIKLGSYYYTILFTTRQ